MNSRWTIEDLKRKGLSIEGEIKPGIKANHPPASFALGRLPGRKMNKTETAYADRLEIKKRFGEVLWYAFEQINLRIGDNCFYSVDFFVMVKSGELECHEVKGYWTDDALVKIRAAAAIFPFRFIAVKLDQGEWKTREF